MTRGVECRTVEVGLRSGHMVEALKSFDSGDEEAMMVAGSRKSGGLLVVEPSWIDF